MPKNNGIDLNAQITDLELTENEAKLILILRQIVAENVEPAEEAEEPAAPAKGRGSKAKAEEPKEEPKAKGRGKAKAEPEPEPEDDGEVEVMDLEPGDFPALTDEQLDQVVDDLDELDRDQLEELAEKLGVEVTAKMTDTKLRRELAKTFEELAEAEPEPEPVKEEPKKRGSKADKEEAPKRTRRK